jgi:hypothetical protein
MESVRGLLSFKKYRDDSARNSDEDLKYEPLSDKHPLNEFYICNRCGNPAYIASSRRRFIIWLFIILLLVVIWTALISLYLGQNSQQDEAKHLIDLCKCGHSIPKIFFANTHSSDRPDRVSSRLEIREF